MYNKVVNYLNGSSDSSPSGTLTNPSFFADEVVPPSVPSSALSKFLLLNNYVCCVNLLPILVSI